MKAKLVIKPKTTQKRNVIVKKGGKGSGDFGHSGRPGKVGGSSGGTGGGTSKLPEGGGFPRKMPRFNDIVRESGGSEGIAYIVHNTLKNILGGMSPGKAYIDGAENENFYGSRNDIVKARRTAREVLKKYGVAISDQDDEKLM